MSNLITTTQAAEIIGVSQSRIRQLVLSGELPGEKIGRDLFVREADARRFTRQPRGRRWPQKKTSKKK